MIDDGTAALALGRRLPGLPPQATSLIGRARELREASQKLLEPDVRLLTLTGPGGTGKTRLAIAVATQVSGDFRNDILFVDLAPVTDGSRVLPTIGEMLAVHGTSDGDLLARLQEVLRDRRLLLVLDNVEQIVEAAPQISALLLACPDLAVLATSRTPLRVRWEYEFPVPPLEVPRLGRLPGVDALGQTASVALFVDRARAVRPDFRLDAYTAPVVAELCVRLDGLPLAIELAAARSKVMSPAALLARLRDRLDVLTSGAREQPARHRTLRHAIDWSYELLSASEQHLFRRLAVFAGGWTLEAAEAVCGGAGLAASEVLELLSELVDDSLVVPELGPDSPDRYRLLETLRQYALERLGQDGEADDVRRRHAGYFQGLAEQAERALQGPRRNDWLARLVPDRDNLRAALQWSLEHGEPEHSARLGAVLWEALEYALGSTGSVGRLLPDARAPSGADPLTAREREVAVLIARGYSNRAIAEELVISPRTADTHVERILGKLGFTARAQVGAWVAERGLVSTERSD